MRKLATLIVGCMILVASCYVQPGQPQYSSFIAGHPECKMVLPRADYSDKINADYHNLVWTDFRGRTIGYSAYEDSTIWNLRRCVNY